MDKELLEIFWETVRDYIPIKEKQVAADHVIINLLDAGLDEEDAITLKSLDEWMKQAVTDHIPEDEEEDEEEW